MIQRVTGAKSGMELVGTTPVDAFWRLSDSDLVSYAALLSESLQRVDTGTCATFAREGLQQNLTTLVSMLDTSLALRWVTLYDKLFRTGIDTMALGTTVPDAVMSAVVQQIMTSLPPGDSARVLKAMASPNGSQADRCAYAIHYFHELGRMRASLGGPVLRTLFGPPPE